MEIDNYLDSGLTGVLNHYRRRIKRTSLIENCIPQRLLKPHRLSCPKNKAPLSLFWDLDARNHEATLLKIRYIRLEGH